MTTTLATDRRAHTATPVLPTADAHLHAPARCRRATPGSPAASGRSARSATAATPSAAATHQLETAGNFRNLRIAAGSRRARPSARSSWTPTSTSGSRPWRGSTAARPSDDLLDLQREVTALSPRRRPTTATSTPCSRSAGRASGTRTSSGATRCTAPGTCIQAAVAQHRATGDTGLLDVAIKNADHLVRTFGDGTAPDGTPKTRDVDGHPVVEMGLVELYRETGNRDYLDLAHWFVDARGHGHHRARRRRADVLLRPGAEPAGHDRRGPRRPRRVPGRGCRGRRDRDRRHRAPRRERAPVRGHDGDEGLHHRRPRCTLGLGGVRRPVRAADRPRLRRDLRGHRRRAVGLAAAARDRQAGLRRRDRAPALQRVPRRGQPGRHRVLLRQPAAAARPRPPGREPLPRPRPTRLVRLRLLPAEHHAHASRASTATWPRRPTAGCRSTSTRPPTSARCGSRPTTRTTAASVSRSPRTARSPWACGSRPGRTRRPSRVRTAPRRPAAGTLHVVDREWPAGDTVELVFDTTPHRVRRRRPHRRRPRAGRDRARPARVRGRAGGPAGLHGRRPDGRRGRADHRGAPRRPARRRRHAADPGARPGRARAGSVAVPASGRAGRRDHGPRRDPRRRRGRSAGRRPRASRLVTTAATSPRPRSRTTPGPTGEPRRCASGSRWRGDRRGPRERSSSAASPAGPPSPWPGAPAPCRRSSRSPRASGRTRPAPCRCGAGRRPRPA